MATLTITEASKQGVSSLVSAAQDGQDVSLTKHGRRVAEVVSAEEIDELRHEHQALHDAVLVMARFATDSGIRADLDQAMRAFGVDRAELEAEIDAGLHTL